MTTGFVDRLAAARIGDTFNQYADSALRRARLARYLQRTARDEDPARRRGARLPRRARLGDPVHLRAPADRHRAGRGDGDDRAPDAGRARARGRCPALEPRADASGHGGVEPPADPRRDRRSRSRSSRARRRPPGRRDRPARACPARRPVRPPPLARRRRGVPGRPRRRRCWDRVAPMERFPVRRNTILLAATLTSLSGMVQLAVAVGTVTLVLVTGIEGILGLGPAIFLTAGALAALPAGRLMDRYGRIPVLAGGCVAGIAGCLTTALGCELDSAALVIPGFALVGDRAGDDPARPRRRRRHVPARAPRPRDLVRPLRRALRRRARPARLPAALRREGARHGRARRAVDRRRRDHGRRARARPLRPARPAHDRPAAALRRRRLRLRRGRRRCARSSAARACSPRSSPRSRASRGWSR